MSSRKAPLSASGVDAVNVLTHSHSRHHITFIALVATGVLASAQTDPFTRVASIPGPADLV